MNEINEINANTIPKCYSIRYPKPISDLKGNPIPIDKGIQRIGRTKKKHQRRKQRCFQCSEEGNLSRECPKSPPCSVR